MIKGLIPLYFFLTHKHFTQNKDLKQSLTVHSYTK
nr:MAG TPA: hypothetical protein [Caudoviricetes sp.]